MITSIVYTLVVLILCFVLYIAFRAINTGMEAKKANKHLEDSKKNDLNNAQLLTDVGSTTRSRAISPDLISTEHRRNPGQFSSPSTHGCSHTEWGASHPQVHRLGNLGGRRGRATRAYFAGAASSAGGGGGGGGVFEPWLV